MKKWIARLCTALIGTALLCAVLAIVWIATITTFPPEWLYYGTFSLANTYIERIEAYKKQHGCYPPNGQIVETPGSDDMGNKFFYEGGCHHFGLMIAIGFDEHYKYRSETRKWDLE